MPDVTYFNDLLARMQEILFHELSECSGPKVELVGIDFLKNKGIRGNTVEEVVDNSIAAIKAGGLVDDVAYSLHGFDILLKLEVAGCIHLPKEIRLREDGIKPYGCPVANMILDQLVEVLGYVGVYVAHMEPDHGDGKCIVKCAIYENSEKIGQVSDWTKVGATTSA